jgi:transcriptional regulator with XRE-family HTH domain
MSLRDLAAKSGVAYGTIWRIEQGNVKRVQPRTARALALALGVRPEQIAEFGEVVEQRSSLRGKASMTPRGRKSQSATTLRGEAPPAEAPEKVQLDDTSDIEIPVYDLADLLAQMRPETSHSETEWGPPVGREVW